MDRRTFLRVLGATAGAVSAGGLLAACTRAASPPSGQGSLSVVTGSFEMLAGDARRVGFGVIGGDQRPLHGTDVDVWLRELDGEVLAGPIAATYSEAAGVELYSAVLDLPEGTVELVAVAGAEHGTKVLQVATPETSRLLAPSQPAPSAPTATVADDLGMVAVCTQSPPCGMHETSLDAALEQGRPIVLLFATPAYCQTAVCGPAVAIVDDVRQSSASDAVWIHAEIYQDEGATLAEAVQIWQLPTEPWLFTVDPDGVIAGRLDGPMLPEAVEELVSEIA